MATSLLLEGDDLEALLQRAVAEGGPSARIVRAEKTRQGGVMGFFAKERYEVAVEIPDDDEPPTPGSGTRISRRALRAAGSLTGRAADDDGPDTFEDLRGPRGRREAGTPPGAPSPLGAAAPSAAAPAAPVDALLAGFADPSATGAAELDRLASGELTPGRFAADGLLGIVDRVSAAELAAARSIAGQPLSEPQSPSFHVPVPRSPGPSDPSRPIQVPREVEVGQAAQSAAYAAMYAAVYGRGTEASPELAVVPPAARAGSPRDPGNPRDSGSQGNSDSPQAGRSWQAARFPVASATTASGTGSRRAVRPDVWASVGTVSAAPDAWGFSDELQNVPTPAHMVTGYWPGGSQNGTVPPETPQATASPSTARPEFTALLEQLRSGTRRSSTRPTAAELLEELAAGHRTAALDSPARSPLTAQDLAALEDERVASAAAAEAAAADAARLVSEHLAAERAQAERAQAEQSEREAAQVEVERAEATRAEAEREARRVQAARAEAERAEAERAQTERVEAERQAAELAVRQAEEQGRRDQELAAERAQAQEAALLAEETARLAALDGPPQAIEAQAAAAIAEQAQRAAAQRAAAERAEYERAQAETAARVRAEAERIAGIQIERHRREAERLAAELAQAEQVATQRAAAEQAAAEQAQAERREAQRLAAELAQAERDAAERTEAERVQTELSAAQRAESAARRGLSIPRRPLGRATPRLPVPAVHGDQDDPTGPADPHGPDELDGIDGFDTEPAQALRGSDAQVIADRATLRSLGLPASWTRRLRPGDRFAAVLKVIEPMPDADLDPEAGVVAVVGPAHVVQLEAYRTAIELPVGARPRPVVVIPATVGPARAAALARARKYESVVVAIEASGDPAVELDLELVLESLETVQADVVIAVVDAERPLEATQAWLDSLGSVDALSLDGAAVVSAPASVLQLGLPVIRLNGIPIDRVTWTALLCAQLEAARPAELRA